MIFVFQNDLQIDFLIDFLRHDNTMHVQLYIVFKNEDRIKGDQGEEKLKLY